MKKTKNMMSPVIAICTFAFVAISPVLWAVVPPPDGAYPGGNTAEGQNALLSRTTGGFNAGIGWLSLRGLTTGNFNTGIGAGTLALNNADENTATGTGALLLNTSGFQNTANGALALLHNDSGSDNTAVGFQALLQNTTGANNTATGVNALGSNTIGSGNTANGLGALSFNTEGTANTAVGVGALLHNTTLSNNTAIGTTALFNNTASGNTAVGSLALTANTAGQNNTALGFGALGNNIDGSQNTAIGFNALSNSSGDGNVAIGYVAGNAVTTASSVICIGALGANVNFSCYIDNIWNQPGGSQAVYVNSDGKLGAQVSSRRFKEEIKPMDRDSEGLFALKPVTFRYRGEIDPQRTQQFGLVAEDVEKVNANLVISDKEGRPYTVRYDAVNAMLLNEFLKEHRKVEEQQATIAALKSTVAQHEKKFQSSLADQEKQIKALAAGLQKVSAQIELSGPAAQLVRAR